MTWIIGIIGYFILIWLFLRFFEFVRNVDIDIENAYRKEHDKCEKSGEIDGKSQ